MFNVSRIIGLFLIFALMLGAPLSTASAEEDPHDVDADKSPYWYKPGEGPLTLPSAYFLNIADEVRTLNRKGIDRFLARDFQVALDHFQKARQLDPKRGILLYNEAITLDKLDRHSEAARRFAQAKAHARGNLLILESPVLQSHLVTP